jgi:drug/metabolite transporter (DMT)-like permease
MAWFSLALVGPFLYAVTNYIDKVALDRYFARDGAGPILIFSALFSALVLPFLFLADPTVFQIPMLDLAALGGVGILNALVLFFYLKALEIEEVSVAVIFYQLVPVFAYGLGYLVLGETLTRTQVFAMFVVVCGTSAISFEIDEGGFRLRSKTILYMLAASFCWALGAVLFKAVALEERVVRSLFWEHLTLAVVGLGVFLFARAYREQFLAVFRTNSRELLALNAANETIYIAANIVMAFAYMLAPVSLVLLANSYQSLFALGIGVVLTTFVPKIATERIKRGHIGQKMAAIAITALGTYLLFIP